MKRMLVGSVVLFALSSGCAEEPKPTSSPDLRVALDASDVSLRESVGIAEASVAGGRAVRATLLTRSSTLSVGALADDGFHEIRVDFSGEVLATSSANAPSDACDGSVSLEQAILAAEAVVNGEAVSIAPDDDDACDREVKVLDGDDVLWEVKIGPDGSVVETEIADGADETEG